MSIIIIIIIIIKYSDDNCHPKRKRIILLYLMEFFLFAIASPKNGGKRCEGEEREYKLCNTDVS